MDSKNIKKISQIFLFAIIIVLPFIKTLSLYFPFVSGKVYLFRAFIVFAFFFWVWFLIKEKTWKEELFFFLKNILSLSLILFFLAQVLVSFFSVDPVFSFFSSLDRGGGVLQFVFWILYFLMLVSLFKKEKEFKNILVVFVIAALLSSFYSFIKINSGDQPNFSGRFGNPAYFSVYLIFAISFSLILYQRRYLYFSFIHKFIPLISVFLAMTLILTTIRGALAGLLSGIFLFCLLTILFLRKENKKLANWFSLVLLSIFVLIVFIFSQKEASFVKNNIVLSRLTAITNFWEVASIRERILNWNMALKGFKEKPFFGWGPENYQVVANKFYDLRANKNEPWFDRPHNQFLEILVSGGVVLFLFYLFWIFAVFYLIFKIARENKVLSFILAGSFLAYLVQGFFFFDIFAGYLGLFPFLAYLVLLNKKDYLNKSFSPKKVRYSLSPYSSIFLIIFGLFCAFLFYNTVFIPWKTNSLAKNFFDLSGKGLYKESIPYLEKAFRIYSPYTYWEIREKTAFSFLKELSSATNKQNPKIEELKQLYDFLLPEFEKSIELRPYQSSFYYVLSEIYYYGFEVLGKNDLEKAENLLKKAFSYSELRIEYINNYVKTLLLQGKTDEAEKEILEYVKKIPLKWGREVPFLILGNFYFEAKKYDQSLEQYDKAKEIGFKIEKDENIYAHYLIASKEVKDYQRIVETAQKFLEEKGPDADTYFNIAFGYWNLNQKDKAKEFFLKAVELNDQFKEYEHFFLE